MPKQQDNIIVEMNRRCEKVGSQLSQRTWTWIGQHWDHVIEPTLLAQAAFLKAVETANDEPTNGWSGKNLMVGKILNDAVSSMKQGDVKNAFLKLVNVFPTMRTGFTVRVLFPFDIEAFATNSFLRQLPSARTASLRRIMQYGFTDGSYAVDLDGRIQHPDVIAWCYRKGIVVYEEDITVEMPGKPYKTRTTEADTDLAIRSVIYLPIVEPDVTGEVNGVVGIYSPVPGVFNPGVRTSKVVQTFVTELNAQFGQELAVMRQSEAIAREIAVHGATAVIRSLSHREGGYVAGRRAIREVVNPELFAKTSDEATRSRNSAVLCKLILDKFDRQFDACLTTHVMRHGDELLALQRFIGGTGVPSYNLAEWYAAVSREGEAATLLADEVDCTVMRYDGPAIRVAADPNVLTVVFHHLIHNCVWHWREAQRHRPDLTRALKVRVAMAAPDEDRAYVELVSENAIVSLREEGMTQVQSFMRLRQGLPLVGDNEGGLGLYWARAICDRMGATLEIGQWRDNSVLRSATSVALLEKASTSSEADAALACFRKGILYRIWLKRIPHD